MKQTSVCYILSYYSPNYIRTTTLVKALQAIDSIKLYQARNSFTGIFRYAQTIWKLVVVRVKSNPDVYILGFRGYEFFWVIRLITYGKVLIFDHMMSPYDSMINETEKIRKHSALAKLVFAYERSILLASDQILTDTDLHQKYFQDIFQLPSKKIVTVPVGADEELFYKSNSLPLDTKPPKFEVLYYGSFLPLHGIDIILRAAMVLRETSIHFTLIGGNRIDLSDFYKMIEENNIYNVNHIPWVEFDELPVYISQSDLGLGGPFGNTGQGRRVITGKTFQFLAMAKPVIVGEIDTDCGFEDKVNCLIVPQGDVSALVEAISWSFQHQPKLREIGQRGYDLYYSRYSINQISRKLREAFLDA